MGAIFSREPEPLTPPTPPPLPPLPGDSTTTTTKEDVFIKPSPFVQKLLAAPEGYYYDEGSPEMYRDPFAPQTGPYFFYGTLADPKFLSAVLGLEEIPILRPAMVVGYECKSWGKYFALIDGPRGAEVSGVAYDVSNEEDAQKLADYETQAYIETPCLITYTDSQNHETVMGSTFKYNGDPCDLS